MKILIVEGSPAAVAGIKEYLPGFVIDLVGNFEQAEKLLMSDRFDCIVMDISSMDYFSKQPIQSIRRTHKRVGLIVTSGRDLMQEKIDALRSGADDFLTKPYDVSELAARIIALERRATFAGQKDLVYNEIRVDILAKVVFVNDLEVDLTKKELELLLYFIEHKNNLIQKDSLISYLSGHIKSLNKTTDMIYAHIKNLKKKLSAAGCKTYLKTVYGLGYKWEDV
jgi:DNA-binding response OmpR family regulator